MALSALDPTSAAPSSLRIASRAPSAAAASPASTSVALSSPQLGSRVERCTRRDRDTDDASSPTASGAARRRSRERNEHKAESEVEGAAFTTAAGSCGAAGGSRHRRPDARHFGRGRTRSPDPAPIAGQRSRRRGTPAGRDNGAYRRVDALSRGDVALHPGRAGDAGAGIRHAQAVDWAGRVEQAERIGTESVTHSPWLQPAVAARDERAGRPQRPTLSTYGTFLRRTPTSAHVGRTAVVSCRSTVGTPESAAVWFHTATGWVRRLQTVPPRRQRRCTGTQRSPCIHRTVCHRRQGRRSRPVDLHGETAALGAVTDRERSSFRHRRSSACPSTRTELVPRNSPHRCSQ